LSRSLSWIEATGEGTVYSYSVVHYPATDEWEDDIPYINIIAHLDEDVYMFSNLVQCSVNDIHVGMPIEATFKRVTDNLTLPVFEPKTEDN
jgi:uncharacterized OB-fold protein